MVLNVFIILPKGDTYGGPSLSFQTVNWYNFNIYETIAKTNIKQKIWPLMTMKKTADNEIFFIIMIIDESWQMYRDFFFRSLKLLPDYRSSFLFPFSFLNELKKNIIKNWNQFFFCHSKQKKITNFESFFTFHWDFLNFFFHLANRIRLNFKTHTHNCRRPNKTEIFRLIN